MSGLKYIFQLYTVIYFVERFLTWFSNLSIAQVMTTLLENVIRILRLIIELPNNFGTFNWSILFVIIGLIFFIADFLND